MSVVQADSHPCAGALVFKGCVIHDCKSCDRLVRMNPKQSPIDAKSEYLTVCNSLEFQLCKKEICFSSFCDNGEF